MFYDSKGMKRNAHQKQMAKLRRERREKLTVAPPAPPTNGNRRLRKKKIHAIRMKLKQEEKEHATGRRALMRILEQPFSL